MIAAVGHGGAPGRCFQSIGNDRRNFRRRLGNRGPEAAGRLSTRDAGSWHHFRAD